jgi:hypothetical protein
VFGAIWAVVVNAEQGVRNTEGADPLKPRQRRCGDTGLMPQRTSSDAPTSNAPTSNVRPGVLGLAALFILATAGVTFFLIGRLTRPEPFDPDYLWRPWPLLNDNEALIGVVSTIVFVVTGAALVASRRNGRVPLFLLAQVVVLSAFAAWLGLAYRAATAGVTGANIGGGMALLLTPVLALVSAALVAGLALRGSRQAKRVT